MSTASPAVRDDRILAPTRWTAIAIVPILTAAFVILYLFPGRTRQLWAWEIRPTMNAIFMGGGYMAGAYFFTRAALSKEWHRIGSGFVAITVFASLLMLATVMHWSLFNHDHVSFWAWLLLYASTPFLLPWLWALNRRTDPRSLPPGDVRVPRGLRVAVGIGGSVQLLLAAAMFLFPSEVAERWPWDMTVLTTRALSAYVAFPAVAWIWFLVDDRWSSHRIVQQMVAVGFVLIGLGSLRVQDQFDNFPLYLAGLGTALALTVVLQVFMDARARAQAAG
jgi:hypothetical protein